MNRRIQGMAWVITVFVLQVTFAQTRRDIPRLFEEAQTAHDIGKYKEALTLLDQCLALNPGFYQAYMLRGSTREQLNDLPGALTDYSVYLETHDDDNEAHLARGLLHFKQGHYDQAREDFKRLLTLPSGPTNTVFYRQSSFGKGTDQIMTVQSGGKAYLLNYIGLCETKLKNYPLAISYFDSAIVIESRDADYFVNRGIAKEGIGDSTSRNDYRNALMLDPAHGIARHNLSVLDSRKGDKVGAENMLSDMIEGDSTMLYAYVQRAYQRLEAGYFKGALEDYSEALKIDQTDPELYMARGITREKLKDYPGAFSDYTNAIGLKENMERAWLNRGNVLSKLNRLQEAIEDYTVAITYSPDFAAAFYNRALVKYRLKLSAEACTDLKRAEELGFKGEAKTKEKICATK